MEPLKTYEYLTIARGRILDWARPLTAQQYSREFPIGPGTLARTLTHVMISEWYYVERMLRRDVPPFAEWPIRDDRPPQFAALETAWLQQTDATRAALRGVRDWSAEFDYRVTDDDGRRLIVTTSASGLFTQLVLHEVHHRAQVMNMLRQLGIAVADLDFNTTMFKRVAAP